MYLAMMISDLEVSLSVSAEGDTTVLRGRGKTRVPIPVSDQLLSSHWHPTVDEGVGRQKKSFHFDLKIRCGPKKPFLISMSLNLIHSYESFLVFDRSIAFAFPDEETRTDQEFL